MNTSTSERYGFGMFLAVAGNLCLAVMNACVRWLSLAGYSTGQIILSGAVISLVCILAWMTAKSKWADVKSFQPLVLLYLALAVCACFSFFYAFAKGSLPEVTMVASSSPFIMAALGYFFLKERLSLPQITLVICGFAGVLMVFKPRPEMTQYGVLIAAFAGAFLCTASQIVVRKLRGIVPAHVFTLLFYACLVVICGVMADLTPMAMKDIPVFLLSGICDIAALVFLYTALKYVPASAVGPFQYSAIVWSIIFNYIIWQGWPDGWALAGAGVILAAGTLFSLTFLRK